MPQLDQATTETAPLAESAGSQAEILSASGGAATAILQATEFAAAADAISDSAPARTPATRTRSVRAPRVPRDATPPAPAPVVEPVDTPERQEAPAPPRAEQEESAPPKMERMERAEPPEREAGAPSPRAHRGERVVRGERADASRDSNAPPRMERAERGNIPERETGPTPRAHRGERTGRPERDGNILPRAERSDRQDRDGDGNGNGNGNGPRGDRQDRQDRGDRQERGDRGNVGTPQSNPNMNANPNANAANAPMQFAQGVLEILNEGWGFLRHGNFDQNGQDIYVAQAQIKRFNLRTGDTIFGQVRPPKDSEKYFGLLRVDKVNNVDPEVARHRANFDELVPIYPDERLMLEIDPKEIPASLASHRENPDPQGLTARFIDLIAPVGKGQRAIIVAPPKAGKTTILKTVALSIAVNHPDIHLIGVLIDERPEEVTDIRRFVEKAYAGRAEQGKPVGDVISSTFDEQPENHMRVADMVLEKAKRLVESGKDVVVLLDSLTRLSRASNLTVTPSGRTLQGGLDPAAIYRPKRFFGAARNIENGGSLTIIASALVETGSRMDDIIFEEFKGTGNMELKLDRSLAERRIYPAIDIKASGTRKDELLYDQDSLKAVWLLHRALAGLQTSEATDFLIERLTKTKSNKEFLQMAGKTGA